MESGNMISKHLTGDQRVPIQSAILAYPPFFEKSVLI